LRKENDFHAAQSAANQSRAAIFGDNLKNSSTSGIDSRIAEAHAKTVLHIK
jgi:hypothetical protein